MDRFLFRAVGIRTGMGAEVDRTTCDIGHAVKVGGAIGKQAAVNRTLGGTAATSQDRL